AGAVTLAEALASRGYLTASVAANYVFLGKDFVLDQGFQYVDARPPQTPFGNLTGLYLRTRIALAMDRSLQLAPMNHRLTRNAAEINTSAIGLLDRLQASQRPFFL